MAVAGIISAAAGVLLLVIVAYVLVGGTISTAETVASAQKDITLLNEARLSTSVMVWNISPIEPGYLNCDVTNNGNGVVADLPHMDVFSYDETNRYIRYRYDAGGTDTPGTWYDIIPYERDYVHTGELDPGDIMRIKLVYPTGITITAPARVTLVTYNGVSATNWTPWP